ncbi:MAG TPA: pyridoxamine 5'-phosphate oxidase family protein [Bacteriovoracaceae bacterium]|nr:pyridoxamine 5'-phosphate oxidase family protein [Bacteriovoracaceae bacterium]
METIDMDLKRLADMIKDIKFTMFTTVNEDGSMHSRPMATQDMSKSEFEGTLWFFSRKHSMKNHSIEMDQHVNLAYANPDKQQYISISGRARITEDKAMMKKLWNPLLKAWFPEGLEDPEISLIGVQIESAEIWDSPPSKVVQMVGFVKAVVTGVPYDQNAHSKQINLGSH